MRKKIRVLAFSLLLCVMISLFASVSFASGGVSVLKSNDFSSGLDNFSAQNAGGQQSAIETCTGTDGGKYAVFYPTLTGTNPGHSFTQILFPEQYVNSTDDAEYLILDFDVATETQYVDGMYFEFVGKDTANKSVFASTKAEIKSVTSGGWSLNAGGGTASMSEARGEWQHLSFVIDVVRNNSSGTGSKASKLYVYLNGSFVGSGALLLKDFNYLHSMRVSFASGASVDKTDTVCYDNMKYTKLTSSYSGNLSSVLSDSTKSLKTFDNAVFTDSYVFSKTRAIAKAGDKTFSTVAEMEKGLAVGDELVLLGNVYDKFKVPCECSVYNPNGYEFTYDDADFTAYVGEDTVSFIEPFESVTVIWHIGDKTEQTVYTEPVPITPPEYNETVDIGGVMCKALGFAKSEGGDVVSELGYASPYNKEFWLVYIKPTVVLTSEGGSMKYGYSDADFESMMASSVSGDTLKLLTNAVAGVSDNNSAFTVKGKSITLDLSGFTLRMTDSNTGGMFVVGAGGSLTVKNGKIYALDNGRIPDGSTSIQRRRVFATESGALDSEIYAKDLEIVASKMMIVQHAGVITLDGCLIDFTNDYDNMIDLYPTDSADKPSTLNVIECDIKAYKTVINTFKPASVSQYNSVINFKNSSIETHERIIAAESMSSAVIDGGKYKCKYLFGKSNLNASMTALIKSGTELSFEKIDEYGKINISYEGSLARKNDSAYPYGVSKDVATVSWNVLGKSVSENWIVGEIPVCPIEVPKTTREIKYDMPVIKKVTADTVYTLTVSPNFKVKSSVSLNLNLTLNVYISEMDFESVAIGEKNYTVSDMKLVLLDGMPYYKLSLDADGSSGFIEKKTVTVTLSTARGTEAFNYTVSVSDYIEKIILDSPEFETYNLAISILGYMKAAVPEAKRSASFENMAAKYNTDSILYPIIKDSENSDKSSAIDKCELVLNDGIAKFRLNFNPDFTGKLELCYLLGGVSVIKSAEIASGVSDGKSYVDLDVDILSMAEGIKVSVGTDGHLYGIADCYSEDSENKDVVHAIYCYAKCAKAYLEGKEVQ